MFGPKRTEPKWGLKRRTLSNVKLRKLCCVDHLVLLQSEIEEVSRRLAGRVGWVGVENNAYGVLVDRPLGKRSFRKPRMVWEKDIKKKLREIRCL